MQLQKFELLHQTINPIQEQWQWWMSVREHKATETFRIAAAKKNKQEKRNAGVQHPSTTALLRDCSLFLCDTVIPYQLPSPFSFSVSHSFLCPFPPSSPELLSVCSIAVLSSISSGIVGHSDTHFKVRAASLPSETGRRTGTTQHPLSSTYRLGTAEARVASQPHCACAPPQTAPEKAALPLPPSTSEETLAHLVMLLRGEKQHRSWKTRDNTGTSN